MPVISLEHTHSVLVSSAGFSYTITAPAAVATTPGTAAADFTYTGATGGATSIITTGTGGIGTDYAVTTGAGGVAAAAATASTGGRGGNYTVVLGAGGAANNAANIGTNLGGKGGSGTLQAGDGGAAANGTDTGGAGGDWAITAGNGGNGDTGGVGGNISLTAGDAGTGGNVNGGSITLTAGRDTGSGTEGAINLVAGGSTRLTVAGTGAFTITGSVGIGRAAAAGYLLHVADNGGTNSAIMAVDGGSAGTNKYAGLKLLRNGVEKWAVQKSDSANDDFEINDGSVVRIGIARATGAVTIAAPSSGVGLTVSGGGAAITGNVQVSTGYIGVGIAPTAGVHISTAITQDYILRAVNTATGANRPAAAIIGTTNASNTLTDVVLKVYSNVNNLLTITHAGSTTIASPAVAGGATTLTITPGAHTAMTAEVLDVSLAAHSVTLTDGTTIALARSVVFGATTYVGAAAGGTETVTTAINAEFGLPVQGANLTMTNAPIAARFLGNVVVGNILTPAAGPTNTLSIASGTAPTEVVADSIMLYSSDDAVGHTIPSFWCEGTNVLATGQADSVSATRVKMRINGTVVTLLAI